MEALLGRGEQAPRLGVAGGAVDKSWLLLRAYAQKTLGVDLAQQVEPQYGAPPLLNQLALRGELPAVLNYWNYGARLAAAGFRELVTMRTVLAGLDAPTGLPVIGWVFAEDYGATSIGGVGGVFILGVGMLVLGIPLMLACFAHRKDFFQGKTLTADTEVMVPDVY